MGPSRRSKQPSGPIQPFRRVTAILGLALRKKGDAEGAIAAWKEAIRLNPKYTSVHVYLGETLLDKGELDGAIAAYQAAVRLDPNSDSTLTSLAVSLRKHGEPSAALKVLRDAARASPKRLSDLHAGFRYDSARYAALAGTGQGTDAPPEAERAALRHEALNWLKADLAEWRKSLDDAKNRIAVYQKLTRWRNEADLAGVRDADELKKLPDKERREWEQWWAEVGKVRDDIAIELLPPPRELGANRD